MSDSAAYEYRAFSLQIADKLSQDDIDKIIYLEQLPTDLHSKPSITILTHLEMRGQLSASKPDDLAALLKKIGRIDLSKTVKEFAKQYRKGRTPTALSDFQRLDGAAVKLSANLKVTLLQCEILLHQLENLREASERMGYKRVEEVVSGASTIVSQMLWLKLLGASKVIREEISAQREPTYCCGDQSDSDPSSPASQPSSLDFGVESSVNPAAAALPQPSQRVRPAPTIDMSELQAAFDSRKAQSAYLPRSSQGCSTKAQPTATPGSTKQPLMPPRQGIGFDHYPAGPVHTDYQPSASAQVGEALGRHVVHGLEEPPRSGATVPQLVTGRIKPDPPPKPKKDGEQKSKQAVQGEPRVAMNTTQMPAKTQQMTPDIDPDYDYPDTSSYTGTSTGDSGFSDSKEFLQVPLSREYQLPQAAQHYPPHGQQQQQQHGGNSKASHCSPSIGPAESGYYKSLQRDAIQGKIMSLRVKMTSKYGYS